MFSKKIKIKYFDKEHEYVSRLKKITVGDWIDLYCADSIILKKDEFALIPLGVAMKLPKRYEAYIVPRSSTFKKYKVLQTNSQGVIDNTYNGNEDEWKLPVYAVEDIIINKNERICQFRIQKVQPKIKFKEVNTLCEKNRGGFGSTDK